MAQLIRPLNGILDEYWDYFPQIVARITRGNLQQLREILDSPWVQAEVQGEKRLMRLMRIGDRHGTILHAAVRTKNIEKITEVLREDRGGRQAFLVYQNDNKRNTPLHKAVTICRRADAPIINLLLENGGDAAKRVRNGNGRYPEELALNQAIADLVSRGAAPGPDVLREPPLDSFIPPNAAPAAQLLAARIEVLIAAGLAPQPPAAPAAPAGDAAVPPAAPAGDAAVPAGDAAVPPAAPAGDAAVPPAAPAGDAAVPPARAFVPIGGHPQAVWQWYTTRYLEIVPMFEENRPAVELRNALRAPRLHEVTPGGERRIEQLMRYNFAGQLGTLLHRAIDREASREKMEMLLEEWTGARKAFMIKDGRNETPMRIAVRRTRDPDFIQFLINNGGRPSVRIEDNRLERPSVRALNNRIRRILQDAEAAIEGEPVPNVQRFIPVVEMEGPAIPAIPAIPAAQPAVPAQPEAPAGDFVPEPFTPIPPAVEFVPMPAEDAGREYGRHFSIIFNAISNPAVSLQRFIEQLNNPWLQQKVNGVRRIENLMRMTGRFGTILHRGLTGMGNPPDARDRNKVAEVLRPERGGQAAFRIYSEAPDVRLAPMHYAAAYIVDVSFMRYLIDNGGRAALKITAGADNSPLDYIPERPDRIPVRALIVEEMFNAPDPDPLPPFVPGAVPEEAGPMEVGGQMPVVAMYRGFSREDVGMLNLMFQDIVQAGVRVPGRSENAICPVCLQFSERVDGCMYLNGHICRPEVRHERLYQAYKGPRGHIMFCTVCGRVCSDDPAPPGGHRHHVITNGTEIVKAPYEIRGVGHRPFGNDCRNGVNPPGADTYSNEGGGGVPEKIRRYHRLLTVACQLQDEIGRSPQREIRNRLILETWKGADVYVHNIEALIERGNLAAPCELLSDAEIAERLAPPVPEGFPDIASPNPVPERSADDRCFVNLGDPHDPLFPTFRMPHRVGGELQEHGGQQICAFDLVGALQTNNNMGTCPFDPPCEGLVHPADLRVVLDSLTQEMVTAVEPEGLLEDYKRRKYESFYESFYGAHPELRPAAPAGPGAAAAAAAAPAQPAAEAPAQPAAPDAVAPVDNAGPPLNPPGNPQAGGAEEIPSMFTWMTDGVCEIPPKKAGRYKTHRKKRKGKTQKRRVR